MISCDKGLYKTPQIFTSKADQNILQKYNSHLKENKDYSVNWVRGFY